MSWFGIKELNYELSLEDIIQFYKSQYLKFMKIGVGNYTEFNVLITDRLIKITTNRLDQLIKGEKTDKNMCDIEKGILQPHYRPARKYDSNRSFGYNNTSRFGFSDLNLKQRYSIEYPIILTSTYIDKYMTAYRSILGEYK